jgi:glutamate--cysteine ligase
MVLASLEESKLDYSEWILEKSKEHKDTLFKSYQNEAVFRDLARQAEESVVKQRQIEESDTLEFDDFLKIKRTGGKEYSTELLADD